MAEPTLTSRQDETAANESRPDPQPKAPSEYVKGLNSRERVDMILGEMYKNHRWTIKDLLFHMVTAEPTKKWAKSTSARSAALVIALFCSTSSLPAAFKIVFWLSTKDDFGLCGYTTVHRSQCW